MLGELVMRQGLRVIGYCAVVISCVLACSGDAKAADQPPPARRGPSTTTTVGASAFSVGYVPMFVMATGSLGHAITNIKPLCGGSGLVSGGRCPENDAIALYVPIVGPLFYAQPNTGDDLYRRDRGPSSTEQALLYSSAALQLGGLVTLIVGVASDRRPPSRASSSTVVAPMTANGTNGVIVGSTF